MKSLTRALAVCVFLAPMAAGCELQRTSTSLAPSALEVGGGGGNAVGALMGLWGSQASLGVASVETCTNFTWNIASQTPTAVSGQFQAVCLGSYTIAGTASGQLEGTNVVRVLVNASAVLPGLGSCPVTLTSTGTIEGDSLRLPYTAQTCVGNFTGTETLRRRSLSAQ